MRRVVVLGVLMVALAGFAGTARAASAQGSGLIQGLIGGGCGPTVPAFAPWDDWASYYFAPNGGFESGSANWSLSGGAAVVTQGNEPWYLAGFGSHALQIPAGGGASTTVCYGLTYPAVRFFVAGQRGTATVHVRVVARRLLGRLHLGAFAQDLDVVQRACCTARHQVDAAAVHRRDGHGADRRPVRRPAAAEVLARIVASR
jgi:hypothetical protein